MFALDHRRRAPRLGKSACQRNAGLPGADDHRIIMLYCCHVRFLQLSERQIAYSSSIATG